MRTSKFLLATLREAPKEAEVISHQLMLRAGMVRKLASGIYTWLPLGIRVLRKVERIIREEMDRIGAMEVLMPAVQPRELWDKSGRWETTGEQLLKFKDRHHHDFCFGPTHEEVVTELASHELRSYKQLPMVLYQLQTKFRDEIRPRFGLMRGREFLMKDAYSFHINEQSLRETYNLMYEVYVQIFSRLGLQFKAVAADNGDMGGDQSIEFQVLAAIGEDLIAYSTHGNYAANLEVAEAYQPLVVSNPPAAAMTEVTIPATANLAAVAELLKLVPDQLLKIQLVKGAHEGYLALVLRGDHELNEAKVSKLPEVARPVTLITEQEFHENFGFRSTVAGPVGLAIPMIVDRSAATMVNFACGANRDGKYLLNANWGRDVTLPKVADIRQVKEGDLSPDGKGQLKLSRGIEVGQIFQLGRKYSHTLKSMVMDEQGDSIELYMGCYGIGVSRTIAAAIEQNHDAAGIIWHPSLAPFQLAIIPLEADRDTEVSEVVEKIYQELVAAGVEVLLDDRRERAGVKFADIDLIGIPHRIILGPKGLAQGMVEYKARTADGGRQIAINEVMNFIKHELKLVRNSHADL